MPPKNKKAKKSPKEKTTVPAAEGKKKTPAKTPAKKKAVKKTAKTKALVVSGSIFTTPKTRSPSPLLPPQSRVLHQRSLAREFAATGPATSTSDIRPRPAVAAALGKAPPVPPVAEVADVEPEDGGGSTDGTVTDSPIATGKAARSPTPPKDRPATTQG